MKEILNYMHVLTSKIKNWEKKYFVEFFIYNVLLMLLVLLRSAGYFDPLLPLTINLIVFTSLIMSVVLLRVRYQFIFALAVVFWIMALVFHLLDVVVWSERMGIYIFQAMLVGIVVMIVEFIRDERKNKNIK